MVEKTNKHIRTHYFTNKMLHSAIKYFYKYFKKYGKKYTGIYCIPRGGLVVGVYLSHKLNIPIVHNPLIGNVLICDDICDSGKTLSKDIYSNCDKFVLISKMKGYKKVKPVTHTIVDDKCWVVFDWER